MHGLEFDYAKKDAEKAIEIKSDYPKAYHRLSRAS